MASEDSTDSNMIGNKTFMSGDSNSCRNDWCRDENGRQAQSSEFQDGGAEMVQWLRVRTALTEGLSLVLCTHVGCLTTP